MADGVRCCFGTIGHVGFLVREMATGQTFSLSYPMARRNKTHSPWEDDREYIYQYIEKNQGKFTSTKEFEVTFAKTLELLEQNAKLLPSKAANN